jgi:hypothetical protein
MFFLQRRTPLDLAPDRILGLRLSLNTPVMAGSDLPPGPGRAAIVVHEEPDGSPNVTIGVRSLKTGDVVFYSYSGDLREESSVAVGADAALSFSESMGFLFDEDEVQPGREESRAMAFGLWVELMGGTVALGGEAPPLQRAAPGGDVPERGGLLELDQVLEPEPEAGAAPPGACLELEDALALDPEPAEARQAPAAAPNAPPALTKFRAGGRAPSSEEDPAPARSGRAALGRLQLVKKRSAPKPGSEERRSWMVRLFSAF